MKFSEQWLREWVNPPVSTEELVERLTLSGLEVEAVTPVTVFEGVIVARVVSVGPHPSAERLRVCQMDVGGDTFVNIVTAASNVKQGMRVPLARVGAMLADGRSIEAGMLRGVESLGMLCSAGDLGLPEDASGVMELAPDVPPGADVRDVFGLRDVTIEVNVTPNRGDCLSIAGMAREIAAQHACAVVYPDLGPQTAVIDDKFPINVDADAACPRYVGRVIREVDAAAATPAWMRERLRCSGIRSINAVVDITNYVMLELGQPLHAFDLGQLQGEIRVRMAQVGERLRLLDGQEVTMDASTLVIADQEKPVAMAGIMGGAESGVTDATRDVFLESAFFRPEAIAGRARRYKLQTDSSYRFERGVDYELQARAAERATALIVEICGGRCGPISDIRVKKYLPRREEIRLRAGRISRLLGFDELIPEVEGILARLGMTPHKQDQGWRVSPPSYRFDITMEVDVIEEVARIAGYDRMPSRVPQGGIRIRPVENSGMSVAQRCRQVLIDRGYLEAITYSFIYPKPRGGWAPTVLLANPISLDMSGMRHSLWPGLLQACKYNLSRQQDRIRLFEVGAIFSISGEKYVQNNKVAAVVIGISMPEQWGITNRPVDFYDLKGDCEALFQSAGIDARSAPCDHPALHPGQSTVFMDGDLSLGVAGALHPDLIREFDIKSPTFAFEFDLAALQNEKAPGYYPISKFPSIRRDISIVLDAAIPAEAVIKCIREAAPSALHDLQLFDVYQGEGIDSGQKSFALGLIFQQSSSTLVDTDVDAMVAAVIGRLIRELRAKLRT